MWFGDDIRVNDNDYIDNLDGYKAAKAEASKINKKAYQDTWIQLRLEAKLPGNKPVKGLKNMVKVMKIVHDFLGD